MFCRKEREIIFTYDSSAEREESVLRLLPVNNRENTGRHARSAGQTPSCRKNSRDGTRLITANNRRITGKSVKIALEPLPFRSSKTAWLDSLLRVVMLRVIGRSLAV
jgi:hypothetical protein